MDDAVLVYTTFPDEETALAVGEALVREKLAACVNVIPGMKSVYAWKGAIERGSEAVAIVQEPGRAAGGLGRGAQGPPPLSDADRAVHPGRRRRPCDAGVADGRNRSASPVSLRGLGEKRTGAFAPVRGGQVEEAQIAGVHCVGTYS
jgi:periplasmic divalent cation tolerance protein